MSNKACRDRIDLLLFVSSPALHVA